MQQENRPSIPVLVLKAALRGFRAVCRFAVRAMAIIACGALFMVLSVCAARTLIPNLAQELLGFKRAQEISDTVIREELAAISELATYEFTYVNHVDCLDQPQLLGHNVVLTDHWFAFDYCGTIKAGFDVDKIDLLWIDSVEGTIGIFLPDAVILSNEISIVMSSYEDRNNVCNPLEPREVLDYLYARKEPELEKALSQGLLDLARENAERVITGLIETQGYAAVFVGHGH